MQANISTILVPSRALAQVPVAHHLRGTSLNRALDAIGDWWTQRILRECFLGVRFFDAFAARLAVPRQTLSVRLKSLVSHGILDTSRGGYRLTASGLALYPWALMVWRWTRKWSDHAAAGQPATLVHLDCGQPTMPVFACAECHGRVTLRDVEIHPLPGARAARAARASARRGGGTRLAVGAGAAASHVALITADRWAHLIISAIFLGCRSFDRLHGEVGIATNVLAQRLALLVETGFLDKRRAADDGRRFHYGLTDRGRDVYPLTITLVQWADRHLPGGGKPPMRRVHRHCGATLDARVLCSHCKTELLPARVTFAKIGD